MLDLTAAGVPSRLLARAIDALAQLALLFAVVFGAVAADAAGAPTTPLLVIAFFGLLLVVVGYPMLFEGLWRGRTPGKAALGLRVVTKEGSPIRFRHAVIRAGADIIDVWGLGLLSFLPGVVGTIAIFASKDGQRLGDMAAGTIVVRERSAAKAPTSVTFSVPRGLEAYASTVDVSRLSSADYQAARGYLLRAPSLAPHARAHVAATLASGISDRIQHQPPPWLSAEQLLAVVVARGQQVGTTQAASPVSAAPVSTVWSGWPSDEASHAAVPGPAAEPPASSSGFTAPR